MEVLKSDCRSAHEVGYMIFQWHGKNGPSSATRTWHHQVPTPPPSRDWCESSHATCWGPLASLESILFMLPHTTLGVVKATPKLMLHIVYGMIHISHFLCKLEQSTMFAIVCFRISQNPCISLHCHHLLGCLERNFAMCHWGESWHLISNINVVRATPCSTDVIDIPMCAQVDFDVRTRNGVVGSVTMMGVAIWPMRQVKFLLGGSKQLRPL